MNRVFVSASLLLSCAVPGWAQAPARPTLEDLTKKAAIIKPRPDELKWQHIPWLTDVAEAVRLAKQEQRPIFLWATTDEPLERC